MKLNVIIICFVFLTNNSAFSRQEPDSLHRALQVAEDTALVDVLNELCWHYTYSQSDTALQYGKKAIKLAEHLNYIKGLVDGHNRTGIVYDVNSRYDSALYHYHKAIRMCRRVSDTLLMARILNNIGLTHSRTGNYKEALDYSFSALEFFQYTRDSTGITSAQNNIGMFYASLKNFPKAVNYFKKAYKSYKRFGDTLRMGALLTNLGSVYHKMEENDKAFEYIEQSIRIKEQVKDYYGLGISYNEMGVLYLEKGETEKGLEYINKTINLNTIIDNNREVTSAYLIKVGKYLDEGNLRKALYYNRLAKDMAERINSKPTLYYAYQNFSKIWERKGNYKKALDFYKRYISVKDSVINDKRINQIYELELAYETEKKAKEITQLTRQREIQQLRIDKQNIQLENRKTQIIAIIAIFTLGLLSLYLWYFKYRHRQKIKLDAALINQKEKRARAVMEAEINERKRIGEELHDGMGQMLSLIKLNMSSFYEKIEPNDDRERNRVGSLINLVDNAFNELRSISHNMAPIMLQNKGLVAAVSDLVDRIKQSNQFKIHFEAIGFNGRLEGYVENTLYRVIQEIFNNIISHAEATEISLQMFKNEKEITILVEDNGKGFNTRHIKETDGMGLQNTFSRVENLNGNVHIDSAENRGTIITVNVPI
ncbi:MAG: sensor histidine kinase [Bacteroidales bacterium]|nr:sensor histidine kinase [Bacteroidales bacterium]